MAPCDCAIELGGGGNGGGCDIGGGPRWGWGARLRNGVHPRGVEAKTTLTQVELLVVHEDWDGGKRQQVRYEHDKGKRAER